ncbi:MAG TPA: hypothetical protein GX702_03070 [Chloroflexi bacterium]|jgi:hypothetical protein|nr:hypothetical protein [Chloroflexota bacterium]
MQEDLTERIQSQQTKIEEMALKVPGYAGYKQKEQRREADRLLRHYVARRYEEQLGRIQTVQHGMSSQGRLTTLLALDRAVVKLQLLIDRIKTASYGYSGLFDALKVDEDTLDALYDFDRMMLSGVDEISAILDRLEDAARSGADLEQETTELVTRADGLNNTFSRRQDVILGQ